MAGEVRSLYRVVESGVPTERDFLSDAERGLRAADWEEPHHRQGLSTWDTLKKAHDLARFLKKRRGLPALYIAAIDVDEGGPLRVERSGPSEGHYTLYGRPADILARARIVRTV